MADGTHRVRRDISCDAVVSDDGLYRYALGRKWADGRTLTWVMLNPSTADAFVDDPTIRRCIGFAERDGFGSLLVVNLFALRATDPKVLWDHDDPIGSGNHGAVRIALGTAAEFGSPVVAAWGVLSRRLPAALPVRQWCREAGVPLLCLGRTKQGHPRHPLYVRADQRFEVWA